jgi:tetratricopeptide (TPR) repeat protein
MTTLPISLRHALESGNAVLFIGAGVGYHLFRPDGTHAPDGASLARKLAANFSIPLEENDADLAKVAQLVENRHGRKELENVVRNELSGYEPDNILQWLFTIRWRAIYTTNFEDSIQRSYALNPTPRQNPITFSISSEITEPDPQFDVPIFHLHGLLMGVENPHVVLTKNDYLRFRENRKMLFDRLKWNMASAVFVYVGYSNQDPNWSEILDELQLEFLPKKPPPSFRITPKTSAIDKEILKGQGIDTIELDLAGFKQQAQIDLVDNTADQTPNTLHRVPSQLHEAYHKNPAATLRLLNSWEYVNQVNFTQAPNTDLFLKGDRPNWSLIDQELYFARDIEDQIYDGLIEFATDTTPKTVTNIMLAPAGYGITTLLKTLAVRLIQQKAGVVFFLKEGASLKEGDVEFAQSITNSRAFFIIDNGADHKNALQAVIQRSRELKHANLFLIGERLNEWRQSNNKIKGHEFGIEQLSPPEIIRLLDYLQVQNRLGKLTHLPRDLQIKTIQNKLGKELLVTMQEATEELGFEAILENEYHGINDDFSQQLYLTVCCLYQYGVMIRDTLLAEIFHVEVQDLYKQTKDTTEGVVIYECINESAGLWAARARHKKIAEIVWGRCGMRSIREKIFLDVIASLNLTYHLDTLALDNLIRSDNVVDTITTLDGKIKFFESACRKDAVNPYIKQHYARMFLREKQASMALAQINEAIKIDPNVRVLYHTKGKILAKLADENESYDIAQKLRFQSEGAFYQGLNMGVPDPFYYQGLAELYFSWAKREFITPQEASEYIEKTEGIISLGLKKTTKRDGLWIISAELAHWIGDQPQHLKNLERAVRESPESIVPRYLLGRTFRKLGNLPRAQEILYPIIEKHPEEYRAYVEYARVLVDLKKPYNEAIAILRNCSLHGKKDPRYISTLGGLYFINKDFQDADKIFEDAKNQFLTFEEMRTPQFQINKQDDPQTALTINGTVASVKKGFAFIDFPGYPNVFCPGVHWNKLFLEKGIKITFELGFSPRGPMAMNINLMN